VTGTEVAGTAVRL